MRDGSSIHQRSDNGNKTCISPMMLFFRIDQLDLGLVSSSI